VSFAELFRTNETKVAKTLDALPSYSIMPNAIELPGRYDARPGSQIVQVFWTDYTDKEIGEAIIKLRPDEYRQPQRRGRGKRTGVLSFLDELSAMRLASHYPKSLPSGAIRRPGRQDPRTAVSIFDDIRVGRVRTGSVLVHSDLEEYVGRARRLFARWFPFGEPPANDISWAKRQRLNT
jgi:hypothetical protein